MRILSLVGRSEEASDYIEFLIEGGKTEESRDYEFYISSDGKNLFVNANLERDQVELVKQSISSPSDVEFFIDTMNRCGYGL